MTDLGAKRLDAAVPETPKLDALARRHGQLGQRLIQLRKPQQEEIANAAYEEGFIYAMNALEVTADHLGKAMELAGYGQCGACEEWFPQLELEQSEGTGFLANPDDDGGPGLVGIQFEAPRMLCTECAMAEDTEWAAPPPPEPTTPEEIAAAEEKRQRARDAVVAQEQRKAEREEILASIADPQPGPGDPSTPLYGISAGNPAGTKTD